MVQGCCVFSGTFYFCTSQTVLFTPICMYFSTTILSKERPCNPTASGIQVYSCRDLNFKIRYSSTLYLRRCRRFRSWDWLPNWNLASYKCIELKFLLPEFKFIFTKSHERLAEVSITHTVYRYWPEIWYP